LRSEVAQLPGDAADFPTEAVSCSIYPRLQKGPT